MGYHGCVTYCDLECWHHLPQFQRVKLLNDYGQWHGDGWYIVEQDDLSVPCLTVLWATQDNIDRVTDSEWEIVAGPYQTQIQARCAIRSGFRQWQGEDGDWMWERRT